METLPDKKVCCSSLSNDPGRVKSIFICYAATCFPHIGMFSFLNRERINFQKGRLRDKMYVNSTLKDYFLC